MESAGAILTTSSALLFELGGDTRGEKYEQLGMLETDPGLNRFPRLGMGEGAVGMAASWWTSWIKMLPPLM